MSTAMPVASMSASTKVSGSSMSTNSRLAPRLTRSVSSASARSRMAARLDGLDLGSNVFRLVEATVQGQLLGLVVPHGVGAKFTVQVAQREIGQVERALARQRQVGGELRVARDPGQRPPMLP